MSEAETQLLAAHIMRSDFSNTFSCLSVFLCLYFYEENTDITRPKADAHCFYFVCGLNNLVWHGLNNFDQILS